MASSGDAVVLSDGEKRRALARGSADRPPRGLDPSAAYAALVQPPVRTPRRSRRISVPVERATSLVDDRTDVVAFRLSANPLEKRTGIDDEPRDETSQTDENDDESGEATPIKTASLARRKRPRDASRRAVRVAASLTECLARMDADVARRRVRSEARRSPREVADDHPPTTIRRRPSADDHPPAVSNPSAILRRTRATAIRLDDAARRAVSHARHAAARATRAPSPPPHHGCARAVPWEPTSGASSTIRAADPDDVAAFGRRYDGNDAWDVRPESFRGDRSAAAAYRLLPPPGDRRFERTRAMARRIFAASRTAVEGYREEAFAAAAEVRGGTNGAPRVAIENAPRTNRDTPARYSVARDRARSLHAPPPFTRRAEARVRALAPYFRVDRSKIHGVGVYAACDVPAREILMEYVGEVIRRPVADRRESAARRRAVAVAAAEGRSPSAAELASASTYMFTLDHTSGTIVDATKKGNTTRWVNHSCEPNCATRCVVLDGKRRVVLYSSRNVEAGEELTYDYQFAPDAPENEVPCACGAPTCRGTINVRVVDPPVTEKKSDGQ